MPDLIIERGRAFGDRFRPYRVMVDGAQRGLVRHGETLRLPVEPGEHTLQIRIDWTGSREVAFRAGDAPVRFTCRPAWNPLLALVAVVATAFRVPWVRLEQQPG